VSEAGRSAVPFVREFARFARRGNMVDLAIGFTVGAAFSTIAKSLVYDIIMPPLGLLLGRSDFSGLFWVIAKGPKSAGPYVTLADAQAAGAVTINYGLFINNLMAFMVVALAMFAVVRLITRAEHLLDHAIDGPAPANGEPLEKKCPFCRSTMDARATRCPQCTSQLAAGVEAPKDAVAQAAPAHGGE
jgi:large conductance mechanosensitive channel